MKQGTEMVKFGSIMVREGPDQVVKDRIACPNCKKEIINKELKIINDCPHCGVYIPDINWLSSEMTNLLRQFRSENLREEAESQCEAGNLQKSIEFYDKALHADPKNSGIWSSKGLALYRFKQYSEAMKCLDEATKIDPGLEEAWRNKGIIFAFLKRNSEAIDCFDIAISIESEDSKAWIGKAMVLSNSGWIEEAEECLKKAVALGDLTANEFLNQKKDV